jgi:hypothetical protein
MSLRLLLIADSDSQLLACQALARSSEDHAVEISVNAIPRPGTPAAVLAALREIGPVWGLSLPQLLRDQRLEQFDAIGVYLTGSKLAEFRSSYHSTRKPLGGARLPLFCGFNGVVLERFEEAIAWRLGYDLICLNGPRDQARLAMLLRHTPFSAQRSVVWGAIASKPPARPLPPIGPGAWCLPNRWSCPLPQRSGVDWCGSWPAWPAGHPTGSC